MAAPMRDSSLDSSGHRGKVVDARTTTAKTADPAASNFEYDDNEWDIGIGDLIIDLDADIEKTNETTTTTNSTGVLVGTTATSAAPGIAGTPLIGGQATMASTGASGPGNSGPGSKTTAGKMAIEHSATVDKGLKMKIKRTKPGTKTSEAKHEIVKSNELNGNAESGNTGSGGSGSGASANATGNTTGNNNSGNDSKSGNSGGKHPPNASNSGANNSAQTTVLNNSASGGPNSATSGGSAAKRGSSSHRRDKASRDKHTAASDKQQPSPKPVSNSGGSSTSAAAAANNSASSGNSNSSAGNTGASSGGSTSGSSSSISSSATPSLDGVNGVVRTVPSTQPSTPRSVFPASTGPGPPGNSSGTSTLAVGGTAPAASGSGAMPVKSEQTKVATVVVVPTTVAAQSSSSGGDDRSSTSPPPSKKIKSSTDPKDMVDVCIGTSVGTITEPDCLGPCEPGTSVTLEGIVWHETEGGVLVVNVTWRGKTYVGTLLDCTRHDWAPPRFCDSPTSDLDARTPKGRGKRGRAAAATTPGNDLSNFTETRSSVHSKLRNGGAKGRRGGGNAGNNNGNTTTTTTGTSSPTPFVPPRPDNKRKNRSGDDDPPTPAGKKSRLPVPASPVNNGSPPASPVLLECPEPNCSKKYKHINGLKYHQSHAHGSADDDDTKDVLTSENDESNIEAPSPATPVKSPEKEPPVTPVKKEEVSSVPSTPTVPEPPSQSSTPKSRPPSPTPSLLAQPPPEIIPSAAPPPPVDAKNIVKPGVLRFGPQEELFVNKPPSGPPTPNSSPAVARPVSVPASPSAAEQSPIYQTPSPNVLPTQPLQPLSIPQTNSHPLQSPNSQSKQLPQFKVKPTAALMPDDKKDRNKPLKKKQRKSPAGSPQPELPSFTGDSSGREEVQSPAYSDISDDAAPVLETESDKNKPQSDKKTETNQTMPHSIPPQYGMYPFYGQPPYLVPQGPQPADAAKPKVDDKPSDKVIEKDGKKDTEFPQKVLQQHYYPPYGYMQNYGYNLDPAYGPVSMVPDDKMKDERLKESPSPAEHGKLPAAPIPNPIQVPTPAKVKTEQKDKHPNENHQILKESIEMKNQMNPYMYGRPPQQQGPQGQPPQQQNAQPNMNHHMHHPQQQMHPHQQPQQPQPNHPQQGMQPGLHQQQQQQHRGEQMTRYYVYPGQRKDQEAMEQQQQQQQQQQHQAAHAAQQQSQKHGPKPQQSPGPKTHNKEKQIDDKKEKEIKQEGVKPTMETQGPPPPPTSQYAYIHPSYMQSPSHYSAIPFDPNHPMYRSMIMHSPYGGNPYMHAQIPRYHAPEDLSRGPPQGTTKALDLLQHHANQYYTSHKIHELQERALKSPTPKTSVASASPSNSVAQPQGGPPGGPGGPVGPPSSGPPGSQPSQVGKQPPGDGKDSRSPPPQRHVHTHHHTHVGLGYPILAGQYPATYGAAAVLASQQAAAVTVINPYPPK